MSESYFQGIKVGDRVWSSVYGWGVVIDIDSSLYPIRAGFTNDADWWNTDGRLNDYQLQTLFWDEVKITPPPKPKRMVKKEVNGYCWIDSEKGMTFFERPRVAPEGYKHATLIFEELE